MSDATRAVTIILNIQPGDMSAVKAAIKELNEMKGIYEDVGASVQKLNAEQQSLGKTQAETARQERELIVVKKEGAEIDEKANRDQIENTKKRTEAEQKIETDNVAKIERIRRPLRDPSGPGKDAFTQRLSLQAQDHNSDQAERAKRNEEAAAKRKEREHQLELQRIDLENMAEQRKYDETVRKEEAAERAKIQKLEAAQEQAEQKRFDRAQAQIQKIKVSELRAVREREAEEAEAEEKRFREAKETFKKIRAAELKNANEMRQVSEQATADMPKHWRNVGLNAGQAVASAARFVGHMRMLKNVGGEALEDVARQFMTIQSRVETIAASTSFFTNTGTMLSGLQTAGQEMEKIIRQQKILRQEATLTQMATVGIGRAAQSVLPFIAPLQLGFTLITAGIVAADIAMDFFGDSSEAAKQKNDEMLASFNRELDKLNDKLRIESELLSGQKNLLEAKFEIQKLIAGDAGIPVEEQMMQQEALRKQSDRTLQRKLRDSVTSVFEAGMPDDVKIERQKLTEEKKQIDDAQQEVKSEISLLSQKLSKYRPGEEPQQVEKIMQRLNFLRGELGKGDTRKAEIDDRMDLTMPEDTLKLLRSVKVKDGVIEDLDNVLNHLSMLPPLMQDAGMKMLGEIENVSIEGATVMSGQAGSLRQQAKQAEYEKKQQEQTLENLNEKKANEAAIAGKYKEESTRFEVENINSALDRAEKAANPDDKKFAIEEAARSAGEAGLMSGKLPELFRLGSSANVDDIRNEMKNQSEFTPAEQRDIDDLINKASDAIAKAEADAINLSSMADKMIAMMAANSKLIEQVQRAVENRDLN